MMGILVPKTCWVNKTAYFVASSCSFTFTMSTMHGHMNIKRNHSVQVYKQHFVKMPCYKVIKDSVDKHKQLHYMIHLCANEFFRMNSLDRISACLTGSGILYLLQRHTNQAAVLRLILGPTETYMGLVDAADVFTACNAHRKIGIYCTVQV
jgi:hypothetical protein